MKRFLLLALFFLAASACAEIPNAPMSTKSHQPVVKTEEPKATPPKDIRGTSESPIVVKVLPDQNADEVEALRKQQEEKKSWLDQVTAWSTLGLAVITLGLAAGTGVLAWFTFKLWKATNQVVADAKDTAERDLRAYIRVNATDIRGFFDHGFVLVAYKLVNVGRTPAHKVRSYASVQLLPYPLTAAPSIDTSAESLTSEGIVFADDGIISWAKSSFCINQIDRDAVYRGTSFRLYLVCEVIYLDIFGKQRSTKSISCVGGPTLDEAMQRRKAGRPPEFEFEYAPFGNELN